MASHSHLRRLSSGLSFGYERSPNDARRRHRFLDRLTCSLHRHRGGQGLARLPRSACRRCLHTIAPSPRNRLEPDSAVLWTEAQTQVQLTDGVLVRAFPFLVLAGVVGVGIPGNLIFPCREVSMVTLTLLGRSPPCPILAARTVASTRSRQSSVWSPWPCSWGEKA